ncbi:MAG: TerB family tellurite resistance protein [Gammaproteobacteria bacterium]|nr:TerB family tellurite resistance protein [Pseudomonadales bacterium]MCP5347947.1 TerB family tellurite resistance protein [Pseudomonadales bacterium]
MPLKIDTETIRRLRDALIAKGQLEADQDGDSNVNVANQVEASMKRVSPFVETLYLVMIADGLIENSEKEAIRGAISLLTHGFLNQQALDTIMESCESEVSQHGVEARLQKIGTIVSADRQDREIAFTLAAAVALADHDLASQEGSLLESIAEWYGVSERRREEILQQF